MRAILRDRNGNTVLTLNAGSRYVTAVSETGRILARTERVDELVARLAEPAGAGESVVPVFANRPRPTRRGHAVLLLALSAHWPQIIESDGPRTCRAHHLTLAYALPLALDARWRSWAEEHAELLTQGGQLVPVPATDLVAVDPCRGDTAWRHRRLLRRHADTTVTEHSDHVGFLDHWSAFTQWRYDRSQPDNERAALHAILEATTCMVREFIRHDDVIARSVVCTHVASRTVFDLMATWHPRHARLRPGIYSAVHNLTDTARLGFRFSLCYGSFPYKDDIVGDAERLTLNDLLGTV